MKPSTGTAIGNLPGDEPGSSPPVVKSPEHNEHKPDDPSAATAEAGRGGGRFFFGFFEERKFHFRPARSRGFGATESETVVFHFRVEKTPVERGCAQTAPVG